MKVALNQGILLTIHQNDRRDGILYVEKFVIVRVRICVGRHFVPNVADRAMRR